MKKIFCYILPLLIIALLIRLMNVEKIEHTHPFGTDIIKNEKYIKKGKIGVDYGKYTYWGKPSKNDTVEKSLNRIQWIGSSYSKEVIWRRAMIFAILTTFGAIIIMNYKYLFRPSKIIGVLSIVYIGIYMYRSHDNAHLRNDQNRLTQLNIKNIKKKLSLKLNNPLENII